MYMYVCKSSLFQVEYAIEAIKLGSTAVGIQTNEGIIYTSTHVHIHSISVFVICTHIACVYVCIISRYIT